VKAVDTSVVVAAFASWHEAHAPACEAIQAGVVLPVACALEAYAVLTRLPAPHRADPLLVREFLVESFGGPGIGLSADEDAPALLADLADRGISGGATYDAVIAVVCQRAGATLLTLDARARSTYVRVGVSTEYLGRT
jgi:predicted nucleic acid-binding protein